MTDNIQIISCDVELRLTGTIKVKVRPEDITRAKGDLNRAVEIALGEDGYVDAEGRRIIPNLDIDECEVFLARNMEQT